MDAAMLSLILLTLGVAGFVGTTVIGRCLRSSFFGTLSLIPVLMAAIALALLVAAPR